MAPASTGAYRWAHRRNPSVQGRSALSPAAGWCQHWGMTAARSEPTVAKSTIVVAIDASAASQRALTWCAEHAQGFGAERVVVVHALHVPGCTPFDELPPEFTAPAIGTGERDKVRSLVAEVWCRPLRDAGLEHHVLLLEGAVARVLRLVATQEQASLVVIGGAAVTHGP